MKKQFMITKRCLQLATQRDMAIRVGCSVKLIEALENGEYSITHPIIAAKIAKEYGLTVSEYNQLVHESHRATRLPNPDRLKKRHKASLEPNPDSWCIRKGG